jgi:hypothetical protein
MTAYLLTIDLLGLPVSRIASFCDATVWPVNTIRGVRWRPEFVFRQPSHQDNEASHAATSAPSAGNET